MAQCLVVPPPPEMVMVSICIWMCTRLYKYVCVYLYKFCTYIYTQYVSAYLYPVDVVGVWGQLFPTLSQPNLSGNEASKTHFLVRLSL